MRGKRASWGVLVISAGAIAGIADTARAGTIDVPGDFGTIQEAVNAADGTDTIFVGPGTYRENVVIAGISRHGLQIYASGEAVIEGEGTSPAITVKGTWDVGVHGFTVHSGGDGVLVTKAGSVVVDGMTAEDCAGDGFRVDRSSGVTLASNTVICAGGDGIDVGGSEDVTLDGNRIDGAAESGAEVTDTDGVTIYANAIAGTGADGVSVTGSGSVSVCSNTVMDCGESGIDCADNSVVVLDENTVDDVVADAVTVSGTEGVWVNYNSFGDADPATTIGGDGVHIESSSQIGMEENTVENVAGHGVCVTGSGATIQSNAFIDVGGTAVFVTEGSSYAYVTGNDIRRPGATGVVMEGTSSSVEANRIEAAGIDGIVVHGGGNSIGGNVIDRPGNDGICVTNGASDGGVVVENNSVTRPGDDGVDLGATSGSEITGNTVVRAKDNGFELLTGAGNLFSGNRAKGSRGFDLYEGSDPDSNEVAGSNKFKSTNKRGRRPHRRPHRR